MSSTNKTTNYELSQFLGSDKPAWLSDYNTDMSKIDAQMKLNANAATAAGGTADAATTAIGTLASLTTTAKTDLVAAINEVDGNADTAQSTANSANSTATTANTKVNSLESFFNINTFVTPTVTGSGMTINLNEIKAGVNNDGTLGKLYGSIFATVTSTSANLTIGDTGFRPTTNINVDGICLRQSDEDKTITVLPITIHTDGTVTLQYNFTSTWDGKTVRLIFPACVIFAKDFND